MKKSTKIIITIIFIILLLTIIGLSTALVISNNNHENEISQSKSKDSKNENKTENNTTNNTAKNTTNSTNTLGNYIYNSTNTSNTTTSSTKESPDKYTWYIKNYVGKNCASIGYTSLGGDRRDYYGKSTIKLILTAEDGNYVDVEDSEALKNYVVTSQDIEPDTELKLVFEKDSNGNEYSNLIETQNISEIELKVKKIN